VAPIHGDGPTRFRQRGDRYIAAIHTVNGAPWSRILHPRGGEVIRTLPFLSPTHLGYLTATIFSRLGLDHESMGLEGGFTWSLEGFNEWGS
jgi:hypothetical protein